MTTKTKLTRARVSQSQFFRICSYLEKHPDLKTSSNDTIRSLTTIELNDMTLSDKTLDNARKTLGPDWVLKPTRRPYTKKNCQVMTDVYGKAILQAVLGLYGHLQAPLPKEIVALSGLTETNWDDAA